MVPPELPKNASRDLQDFLRMCLVIDPDDRADIAMLSRHTFLQDIYRENALEHLIPDVKFLQEVQEAGGDSNYELLNESFIDNGHTKQRFKTYEREKKDKELGLKNERKLDWEFSGGDFA